MRLSLRLLAAAQKRNFYVTTPIFYVNAGPHIGHVYSSVVADTVGRVERLLHPDTPVVLSTGTDEHGDKIQRAAADQRLPLQDYCQQVSDTYKQVADMFDVQYTDFVRTTQQRHKKAVQHFWLELEKRGHIYKTLYSGWYNVSDECFVPESQLKQVTRDGQTVMVTESGHSVEWTQEHNYMFRLSSFREHILEWLSTDGVVTPAKYQQQLRETLKDSYLPDISISRPTSRVHWAIPVPTDETQSVYVWLDALVNYLTVAGYPDSCKTKGIGWLWPADLHVVGKDILKFHAIYWPAFLMGAGLHPPRRVLCHGHWTVDGHKMSKSLRNTVDPVHTPGGAHALRYFLLREATMHSDANYSESKLVNTANSELADSLGNLVSRCTRPALNPHSRHPALTHKVFTQLRHTSAQKLIPALTTLPGVCREFYAEYQFYRVADACMSVLHATNAMFDAEAPWLLRRRVKETGDLEAEERLGGVLHVCLESVRVVAITISPLLPTLTRTLLNKLNVSEECRSMGDAEQLSWAELNAGQGEGEGVVARPLPSDNFVFFPRIQPPTHVSDTQTRSTLTNTQ